MFSWPSKDVPCFLPFAHRWVSGRSFLLHHWCLKQVLFPSSLRRVIAAQIRAFVRTVYYRPVVQSLPAVSDIVANPMPYGGYVLGGMLLRDLFETRTTFVRCGLSNNFCVRILCVVRGK